MVHNTLIIIIIIIVAVVELLLLRLLGTCSGSIMETWRRF